MISNTGFVRIDSTTDSIAIGDKAGQLLDSDDGNNIAIGANALNSTTDTDGGADNNIAIGTDTLTDLTGGDHNIAIGLQAGRDITTGDQNIGIGSYSLYTADGGETGNIAIGYQAMKAADHDDVDFNIAIGLDAMASATNPGTYNIAIGREAMSASTMDARYAIGIGRGACKNLEEDSSIGIGYLALEDATSCIQTVMIGYEAGKQITGGDYNTGLGSYALYTNIDGSNNTAIGYKSFYSFEADSASHGHNTGVGKDSGYFCSTGTYNTFIGSLAGQGVNDAGDGSDHLTGDLNTCVGYAAGKTLQGDADYNTLLGSQAGDEITTGDGNTCVGYNAGESITTGSGNVIIGREAGDSITSGSYNVAIGYKAGEISTSSHRSVAIGYYAGASSYAGSVEIGDYGGLKWCSKKFTMDTFTNVGDNIAASNVLFMIPQYGFLQRVVVTVITASGGTGEYNLSLGTAVESAGDAVAGRVEIIGAGASDLTGCVSRTQATDAAGDTNVDIITAKQVHIFESNLAGGASAVDNNGAWMANDMYAYLCHANGSNANNATNAEIQVVAQWWGQD